MYTYSPEEIDLIIAGYKVVGWNSIAVSRTTDSFTMVRGIRGKNTRTRSKDSSAVIFIDVQRTSPVNTAFSEVLRQDIMYGTGRLEVMIKDNLGQTLLTSNEAFIDKYPDDAFTVELNNRRWSISCLTTTEWKLGGNESAQESLFNNLTNSITSSARNVVDRVVDIF